MLAAFTLTAPWSKGANAITEAETSCLKITCCNMAILPVWSLVPELACLSASSPPSSFESSLTGRKPPSSFKSSLTGRRRRASRRRLADYRGHRRRSRRSVPPSSLLSCDSRVLWHSNGARTLLLIQEFACSSTTRHGLQHCCAFTLPENWCRAEPARFKSWVKRARLQIPWPSTAPLWSRLHGQFWRAGAVLARLQVAV